MALRLASRWNIKRILIIEAAADMLCWLLSTIATLLVWYKDTHDPEVLNEIKAHTGSSTKDAEADAEYRKLLLSWERATHWVTVVGSFLFFTQLFLIAGVNSKNRCLLFTWIFLTFILGVAMIVTITTQAVSQYHKYFSLLWPVRVFFVYLAASYIIQITNELSSGLEVAPPEFRPQTDDPREFREGLNYPAFPRSLEFASRVVGAGRLEHAHPRRWVPTYDAIDSDGRMVVVVDDPVYEAL